LTQPLVEELIDLQVLALIPAASFLLGLPSFTALIRDGKSGGRYDVIESTIGVTGSLTAIALLSQRYGLFFGALVVVLGLLTMQSLGGTPRYIVLRRVAPWLSFALLFAHLWVDFQQR